LIASTSVLLTPWCWSAQTRKNILMGLRHGSGHLMPSCQRHKAHFYISAIRTPCRFKGYMHRNIAKDIDCSAPIRIVGLHQVPQAIAKLKSPSELLREAESRGTPFEVPSLAGSRLFFVAILAQIPTKSCLIVPITERIRWDLSSISPPAYLLSCSRLSAKESGHPSISCTSSRLWHDVNTFHKWHAPSPSENTSHRCSRWFNKLR